MKKSTRKADAKLSEAKKYGSQYPNKTNKTSKTMKRISKTMLLFAVMVMVMTACHTSQKLESQDGTTFRAKQKEPTNVYYVTKYTYTDKHGKTYPVELDYRGRAYYTPKTWYGGGEFKLPEIGKKINPDAYDKTKPKGEWKKHLRELMK